MTDQNQPEGRHAPLSDVIFQTRIDQEVADAWAAGMRAVTDLVRGAHHPTWTKEGQDLAPLVRAYAELGKRMFPDVPPFQDACAAILEELRLQMVARSGVDARLPEEETL